MGEKPMSNETLEKPTLESLAVEVRRLQERLEDMEDLMELRAAVERNGGKPGAMGIGEAGVRHRIVSVSPSFPSCTWEREKDCR
jgi:hypothetical protein